MISRHKPSPYGFHNEEELFADKMYCTIIIKFIYFHIYISKVYKFNMLLLIVFKFKTTS
jgi:hypothetical protein